MDSGVYKIINTITNDFYIGSSCKLNTRKKVHFNQLNKNIHNNKFLQNSYNKYNESDFIFEIIEYCEKEMLLEREQFYMDNLKPTYNNLLKAGNSLGYKHTKQSIEKLRGQDKTHCSKKLYQYNSDNQLVKEWNSCSEFARFYNISRIAVIKAVKKLHKCRGFIVSYNPPTL